MPRKQPPIRIRNKDVKEYQRLKRNTQAKIRRVQKKYGIDLRNEVSLPNLESFSTRKQFNNWKEQQRSFTNPSNQTYQYRKNKKGVVASKKEINQLERDTRRAQEIADNVKRQTENKPFISGGKQKSTYGRQQEMLGKPNYGGIYRPGDFDFDKYESRRGFELESRSMDRRSDIRDIENRMDTMKQNYIKKLEEDFNSDAEPIIRRVKQMPSIDFFEMTLIYDEMSFYTLYNEDTPEFLDKINGYIDQYERGDVDLDLELF